MRCTQIYVPLEIPSLNCFRQTRRAQDGGVAWRVNCLSSLACNGLMPSCYFYWILLTTRLPRAFLMTFSVFCGQKSKWKYAGAMLPQVTHFIMDADVVQVQVKVESVRFILLTCYLTIYCRIGAQFAVRWALLFSVICCSCCSSCATSGTSSTSSSCRSCSAGWAAAPCAGLVAFTGQRLGCAGNCK